jgi:hypothetical protein
MRWLVGGIVAAFISSFTFSPAMAISCGSVPGVTVELTGIAGAQCLSSGSGDLVIPGNFTNALPVTWGFTDVIFPGDANIIRTDGDVSFTAPSGYEQLLLGFQLDKSAPHPDWFTFTLPAADASGHFDSDFFFNITIFHHTVTFETFSDKIKDIVLYGDPCLSTDCRDNSAPASTPLPAAVWLFGTVLAGGAGVSRWRKRKGRALATAAA